MVSHSQWWDSNFLKPISRAEATNIFAHNSPAARATELFKPSTDLESRLVSIKKTFSVWGLGFSVGDDIMGTCFRVFMAI